MIYTILNITILAANFIILIYTLKSFGDIIEEVLTPKLSKLREFSTDYLKSSLDIKMHDLEIKMFHQIAKIVQDQHDNRVKDNEINTSKSIIYKDKRK